MTKPPSLRHGKTNRRARLPWNHHRLTSAFTAVAIRRTETSARAPTTELGYIRNAKNRSSAHAWPKKDSHGRTRALRKPRHRRPRPHNPNLRCRHQNHHRRAPTEVAAATALITPTPDRKARPTATPN